MEETTEKTKTTNHKRGKDGKKLVQRSLWRRNYRVEDVSHLSSMGCDLLVGQEFRIEVKSTAKKSTPIVVDPAKFDVLCIVFFSALGDSIFYLKDKSDLKHMVSPSNPTAYYVGTKQIKLYFTKKPQEILGSPH